ncbi:molecular chaperone DnaJ [Puteibacter caeruleilacunae]|nr:molecular chaperone DnaJ [Puteibacter caeruleilacunae]
MGKFGKWIAGGLGFAIGGPIGAILGFTLGSMFESKDTSTQYQRSAGHPYSQPQQTTTGGFAMSLLVLVAAVMKADGKVMRSELDYVKQYFTKAFGPDSAAEAIKLLRDLLNQNIPVTDVCHQISRNMDYSSRLQLLHLLFGIAQADGHIDTSELNLIEKIAANLGINTPDFDSIRSMFVKNNGWAYSVLEIESSANDDEVKKAYRKMAIKYHPDKVSYLGEDFQNQAKEKFQKLNEAYEAIKKERNIN